MGGSGIDYLRWSEKMTLDVIETRGEGGHTVWSVGPQSGAGASNGS